MPTPLRCARIAFLLVLALCASAGGARAQDAPDLAVEAPDVLLAGVPFDLTITSVDADGATYRVSTATGRTLATGDLPIREAVQVGGLEVEADDLPVTVTVTDASGATASDTISPPRFPGWISLLPPILAIVLALVFREVVVSLFFGVWVGALFVTGLNPLSALWRTVDMFVVPSVADGGNASILVFSGLLGAMVGVISRSGGTRGIVEAVRPLATTPRRAQLATFLGGCGIFFDDYANTLIIGNTFRPITDRLKVSREKLAYLVDSTAAPVVTIVFVSTWVGFEISLIRDGLRIAADQTADPALSAALSSASPFTVFLSSIPYLFYPLLTLLMVLLVILTQRDFGPMHAAEMRARTGGGVFRPGSQLLVDTETGGLDAKEGAPLRWFNAAGPVLTVVAVVLLGLYFDGRGVVGAAPLWDTFGAADPFKAILWGSLAGCVVAIGLAVGQRILTLKEALESWVSGARAMTMAFVILILAWSLGAVTQSLGTARYLTLVLSGNLAVELLPVITFATAAVISFCTGTSWATMTILLPLVVPLSVALGGAVGFADGAGGTLLVATVSSVLAGSIFGDHCSPISDTTVLSSMASACDHLDHVRTQLPYAVAVAVVAMLLGSLGTAYGLPTIVAYMLSGAVLFGLVRFLGKPVPEPPGGAVE
ncbi:MAG: Na+/H+ antiporter NhaC family protein [Gemmatimonadota bacterium]|nr:Na+/H+ antiporter NhaC family protein [Gemmatimonadota bacterium]